MTKIALEESMNRPLSLGKAIKIYDPYVPHGSSCIHRYGIPHLAVDLHKRRTIANPIQFLSTVSSARMFRHGRSQRLAPALGSRFPAIAAQAYVTDG
jgi:hypothetical protein